MPLSPSRSRELAVHKDPFTLRAGSHNVGNLEGLCSDLEGKLRGASAQNSTQNASAARHIVGNIRIELQGLSRVLTLMIECYVFLRKGAKR